MSREEFYEYTNVRKKRKPIPKIIREQVYKKCNGHCAYCGCELEYKDMQVDHIIPHDVLEFTCDSDGRKGYTEEDIESIDNYLPSCRSCNHFKSTFGLEAFRENIAEQIQIRKNDPMNRLAERYGIITFHEWDKKFYFEKEAEE